MRDSEGNPVDTKFLEIVDAARQEGYAQGWKDAVTSMITAANNMQHPKMDVRDAATVSNPVPVAAHAAQGGGLLTNTPGGSDSQLQYNNAGAFGGTAGLTWNPAVPTTVATSLRLVNETNTPADLDPLVAWFLKKIVTLIIRHILLEERAEGLLRLRQWYRWEIISQDLLAMAITEPTMRERDITLIL
jgi:hypothetical protein